MQMVATSKMRRAQERMRLARPYAQKCAMSSASDPRRIRITAIRSW